MMLRKRLKILGGILFIVLLFLPELYEIYKEYTTSPTLQLGADCDPELQQQAAEKRKRAHYFFENNDYVSSLHVLDTVVAICPEIWDFRYRAQILLVMGDTAGAEEAIDEVMQRNPYEIELLPIKAYAMMRRESYDSAAILYERILRVEPSAEVHICLCKTMAYQDKLEEALVCLNKAIAADNTYADAYILRSGIYHMLYVHDKALGDIRKAVALSPKNASFHLLLATQLFDMGRYAEALQACNQCLQLTRYSRAHLLKGKALLRLGKRAEALPELQLAKAAGLKEAGKLLEESR